MKTISREALQTATELGNKLTSLVVQQRIIDRMCDKLKVIRLKRNKSYRRSESEATEQEPLSKVLDQLKWIDKHVTGQGRREAGKHAVMEDGAGKSGISSANLALNRQQWVREHPIERRNGPITVHCLAGDRYVLHENFQRGCCLQVKLSTSGKLFASVLSWYAPTRGT